jgi:hypothetical protein
MFEKSPKSYLAISLAAKFLHKVYFHIQSLIPALEFLFRELSGIAPIKKNTFMFGLFGIGR